MPRIYTQQLREGCVTAVRSAAVVIAQDPAAGLDASATPTWISQALDCTGYDSIFVGIDVTGGTAPSANLQAVFRDSEAADGAARWRQMAMGARDGVPLAAIAAETTGLIVSGGAFVELRVFGHAFVFLRITAVGGTVAGSTAWTILAKPGQMRPSPGRRFNG